MKVQDILITSSILMLCIFVCWFLFSIMQTKQDSQERKSNIFLVIWHVLVTIFISVIFYLEIFTTDKLWCIIICQYFFPISLFLIWILIINREAEKFWKNSILVKKRKQLDYSGVTFALLVLFLTVYTSISFNTVWQTAPISIASMIWIISKSKKDDLKHPKCKALNKGIQKFWVPFTFIRFSILGE